MASKKDAEPKPSAVELLARLSGKKKMEPTVQDAIEEIEASRLYVEKLLATEPRPPQDFISNATGAEIAAISQYRVVSGEDYRKRPPMRRKDCSALITLFEATHGHRWACNTGWAGRKGRGAVLGIAHFEMHASHWHGVRCEIGEKDLCVVVALELADNELEGEIGGERSAGGSAASIHASLELEGGSSTNVRTAAHGRDLVTASRIVDLVDLRAIDLSRNLLEGPMPNGILLGLTDLEKLDLHANQLSGPIGPALGLPPGTPASVAVAARRRRQEEAEAAAHGWAGRDHEFHDDDGDDEEDAQSSLGSMRSGAGGGGGGGAAVAAACGGGGGGGAGAEASAPGAQDYEWLDSQSPLQTLNLSSNHFTGPLPLHLLGPPADDEGEDAGAEYDFFYFKGYGAAALEEEDADSVAGACSTESGGGDGGGGGAGAMAPPPAVASSASGGGGAGRSSEFSLRSSASFREKVDSRLLPGLVGLDLSNNHLTGPIPSFLPPPTNSLEAQRKKRKKRQGPWAPVGLRSLKLAGNGLSGPLPWGLGGLKALREIDLGGNKLTGPLPYWLCGLRSLELLDLSNNALTGPLPPDLCAETLPKLSRLYLQYNFLSGPLSPALGSWSATLVALNLSHNNLQGKIPEDVANLTRLQVLLMHGNPGLVCPMPAGLTNLTRLEDMCLIDSVPSDGLEAPRRFDKRRFETIRVKGKAHGFNSWESPG